VVIEFVGSLKKDKDDCGYERLIKWRTFCKYVLRNLGKIEGSTNSIFKRRGNILNEGLNQVRQNAKVVSGLERRS
jgi:hypothetical protein